MEFTVRITSKGGKKIEFIAATPTGVIRKADVKFDTVLKEKQLRKKSKDVQVTVEMQGLITAEVNQQMKELADWVRDFNMEETYRRVEIEAIDEDGSKKKMQYILEKMFAINFDYENRSDDDDGVGMFTLSLMQNGDALADGILVELK